MACAIEQQRVDPTATWSLSICPKRWDCPCSAFGQSPSRKMHRILQRLWLCPNPLCQSRFCFTLGATWSCSVGQPHILKMWTREGETFTHRLIGVIGVMLVMDRWKHGLLKSLLTSERHQGSVSCHKSESRPTLGKMEIGSLFKEVPSCLTWRWIEIGKVEHLHLFL